MVSNLPAVVFHQTVRGFKKARKQAQRGVKAARYVAGRVRSAEKSFYFHLRDTRAGRALLEAATFARAPRELSERRRAAAIYVRRLGEPLIDPAKGYGRVALNPSDPSFASVLTTSRRLFEAKHRAIAELMAGESTLP